MQKVVLTLAMLLASITSGHSQSVDLRDQESLFKIGFIGPNLEYETSLTSTMSLRAETGLSLNFGYGGRQIGWRFDYGLFAILSPRYFYNLDRRLQKDMNIANYSGNYISFVSMALLNEVASNTNDPNQFILGPTWGLQRNFGENWFVNFEIGAGLSITNSETDFVPILGLDVGIVF